MEFPNAGIFHFPGWKRVQKPSLPVRFLELTKNLFRWCSAKATKCFIQKCISILLLFVSLPEGSCSCERYLSVLRRLKALCRSSMAEERLDSLALGYINQEKLPSPEEVLRVWVRSGHRRISFAFGAERESGLLPYIDRCLTPQEFLGALIGSDDVCGRDVQLRCYNN